MRRVGSVALVGLGVFLLVLGALFAFWVPDRAVKTPLTLNITQIATGPAVFSAGGGKTTTAQLRATRRVQVDSAASNSKVVVVVESLCIVKIVDNPPNCVSASDKKGRLVSLTTDRVAADRRTGESVNDSRYGGYINSDTSAKHRGLTYKFPFDTQKKPYPFFDPNSSQAPDAKYLRTQTVAGIECYVFEATEKGAKVDVATGVPGTYDDTRTVWVDPVTGTIVKGVEHQVRTLTNGEVALDTTLTFDSASIKYQAKQAQDGIDKIDLLTKWVPLGCVVLGLAALIGGVVFARNRREQGPDTEQGGRHQLDGPDGPVGPTGPTGEPDYAGSTQR